MELATINFHGDTLFAFEREGEPFVAMKPIVLALGLDWEGQRQRIARDQVLSEGACMIPAPSAGGIQETICLPLHLLNGWLFGVDAARVKPEIRDKITLYRRECFQALADHFGASAPTDDLPHVPQLHDGLTLQERRQMVNEARVTFDRQSARELWMALGLPMTPSMVALTASQRRSNADLKSRMLQHIMANPGATQREVVWKFKHLGYREAKDAVVDLARDGLIKLEGEPPKTGGRTSYRVMPTTH